jgi:hypothetical protein
VDAETAVRNAHRWFEQTADGRHQTMTRWPEWIADGVCRCPDECLVAPEGWCEHGLASWTLIVSALAREDANSLTMGLEGRLDD